MYLKYSVKSILMDWNNPILEYLILTKFKLNFIPNSLNNKTYILNVLNFT